MSYQRVTAPATQAIAVAELKAYLVIEHAADDAVLSTLIDTATELAEHQTDTAIMTQTWRLTLDGWPSSSVDLRPGPVASIDEVRYLDENGDQQVLASAVYQLQAGQVAKFRLAYDQSWPTAQASTGAIEIDYITGAADAADVPSAIKHAIKLIAGDLNENKEAASVMQIHHNPAVDRLLATKWVPSL